MKMKMKRAITLFGVLLCWCLASAQGLDERFHGNWFTVGDSRTWTIGLYEEFAIWDSDFWEYDKVTKKHEHYYVVRLRNGRKTQTLHISYGDGPVILLGSAHKRELLSQNGNVITQYQPINPDEKLDAENFFRNDTIHLRGYLHGYTPELGFSTGSMAYLRDVFTRDGKPRVVHIHSDGRFECDIPAKHPIWTAARMGVGKDMFHLFFYGEPGQTVMLYVDWTEMRGKSYGPNQYGHRKMCVMGPAADVNVQLRRSFREVKMYHDIGVNYRQLAEDAKTLNCTDYYLRQRESYNRSVASIDDMFRRNPVSPKVEEIVRQNNAAEFLTDILDYPDIRNHYGRVKESLPDSLYHLASADMDFGSPAFLVTDDIVVNRVEYSAPVWKPMSVVANDDSAVDSLCRKVDYAIDGMSRVYGQPAPNVMSDLVLCRLYGSNMAWYTVMNKAKLAKRAVDYLLDNTTPAARDELLRMSKQQKKGSKKSAYEAPNTLTGKVFHRLLEPYRGKAVLLDFWGLGCGPCRSWIQQSADLRQELDGCEHFKLVFVCGENEVQHPKYNEYVTEQKMTNRMELSTDDKNCLEELFGISGIPRYILVGPDGRVLNDDFHPMFAEGTIRRLAGLPAREGDNFVQSPLDAETERWIEKTYGKK